MAASRAGTEFQGGEDVVAFQARGFDQHVLNRHACREQLQDAFDGVAQPLIVGLPWQIAGSDVIRANRDIPSRYRPDRVGLVVRWVLR